MSFARVARNFASFRRVPTRIVIGTAIASVLLMIGMHIMGQPLYMVALFGLLPWFPVLMFESLWKVEHYTWIAIFAVFTVLQVGHLGEHIMQVSQLVLTTGTLACPPPVDSTENASRAMAAGLRSPQSAATYYSSSLVIKPDADGNELMSPRGDMVTGPAACGVFGQLDIEIVHLVWEVAGWLVTLVILLHYPRNKWLWFAAFWLILHTVEHLFISYTFFLDHETAFRGMTQVWGTLADGNIVTAFPLGREVSLVRFYNVAGINGIFARGGLLGTFLPGLNPYLPARPFLHFYYNTLVTVPTVIGFVMVMRETYDKYLAMALPRLSKRQLIETTPLLVPQKFRAGKVIVEQGAVADAFFVISKGEVDVFEGTGETQRKLNRLGAGDFFGEMAYMEGGRRTATVCAATDVEVMRMDYNTFAHLLQQSEMSRQDIEAMVAQRAAALAGV
ncbi:MAG: cyclic nucleotide-binding domain-containing protein [Anaerolineae bacterium]|nr:cyclic nucleotide-binding domain-containing protein [Anaerolineae bacterium]